MPKDCNSYSGGNQLSKAIQGGKGKKSPGNLLILAILKVAEIL
jgi:hypothetical protein